MRVPRIGAVRTFLSCFTLFPVSRWGRYDSNCILCVTHLLLWFARLYTSIVLLRVRTYSALVRVWSKLGGTPPLLFLTYIAPSVITRLRLMG